MADGAGLAPLARVFIPKLPYPTPLLGVVNCKSEDFPERNTTI
jgi:hypothetical protein